MLFKKLKYDLGHCYFEECVLRKQLRLDQSYYGGVALYYLSKRFLKAMEKRDLL